MEFIEYPKCSTCKKAKKWLEVNNIDFIDRNIITETPKYEELEKWINYYNIEISKLFNTSGIKYRELKLKDKLKEMTKNEKIQLLASNGMLIKRPLLITKDKVLIGFKEKEWIEYFKEEIK